MTAQRRENAFWPPTTYVARRGDGGVLAIRQRGRGPMVVLVHGLGLDGGHWAALADELVAAGRRVVAYDQRGFGGSPAGAAAFAMDDLAADLRCVIETTAAGESIDLVAHSLGGMVAQRYAVANRERIRTLTLVSTTAHNGRRASRFAAGMSRVAAAGSAAALADAGLRGELDAILAAGFPWGPPPLRLLLRGLDEPSAAQSWAWRAMVDFSVKDAMAKWTGPTLVFHGTHDTWIPYSCGEWLGRAVPGARFVSYPETGHFPQLKHHRDFADHLLQLLTANGR